jgi:hypothetical protein
MSNGIKDLLQRVKDAPRPTQQVQTMRLVPRAPLFLRQFAGDLTGNFLRDKLGLETLGNLVGSRDIDENTLGSSEYRALQQAAVKTLGRETSNVAPDTWQLNYDDYGLDEQQPIYCLEERHGILRVRKPKQEKSTRTS